MAVHTPEDIELIHLGQIDVEDLPLSQFNRKSTSPHIDVFCNMNYMRYHLVRECQALLLCPCATVNVANYFFIFQTLCATISAVSNFWMHLGQDSFLAKQNSYIRVCFSARVFFFFSYMCGICLSSFMTVWRTQKG